MLPHTIFLRYNYNWFFVNRYEAGSTKNEPFEGRGCSFILSSIIPAGCPTKEKIWWWGKMRWDEMGWNEIRWDEEGKEGKVK